MKPLRTPAEIVADRLAGHLGPHIFALSAGLWQRSAMRAALAD